MAEGSCFEFSGMEETSSSGKAPVVVKATSASPRAPGVSFALILAALVVDVARLRGRGDGDTRCKMPGCTWLCGFGGV